MKYEEPKFSTKSFELLNEVEKAEHLIATSMQGDINLAKELIFSLINSSNINIGMAAVISFGHLARRGVKFNIEQVRQIFAEMPNSKQLAGVIEDSLDDICIFGCE